MLIIFIAIWWAAFRCVADKKLVTFESWTLVDKKFQRQYFLDPLGCHSQNNQLVKLKHRIVVPEVPILELRNAHLGACSPIREPGMLLKIRPSVKTAPSLLKIFPWTSSSVITRTLMHPCPGLQVRTCPTPGASPVLWRWHVRAECLGEHGPAHLCPLQPGESLCPVTDPCWPPAATEMSTAGAGSSQNHGMGWLGRELEDSTVISQL